MPIYEYQCEACGHLFEDLILGSSPEPDTCPKCGAKQVRRAISRSSFQLKGDGWYVTDYGSGASPPVADESASGDDGTSSGESDGSSGDSGGSSGDDGGGSDDSDAA